MKVGVIYAESPFFYMQSCRGGRVKVAIQMLFRCQPHKYIHFYVHSFVSNCGYECGADGFCLGLCMLDTG